jgi:hypothetical protein
VWTDKQSYSPGESATIFGSGFLDRSTINVEVVRPDLIVNRWNTSSDADGNFTTTYRLDGIVGTYNVTATDGTNSATTTFTDPTFGLTSIGSATCPPGTAGITSVLSLSTSFGTGILQAQKIAIPSGGATIKSVSINLKSVGSEFLNFALYTDSSGTPSTLVSASVTRQQTATLGWMTVTYATPFYVSSGSYWIAFQMQYGVSAVAYDTSGSNSRYYRGYAWGSFPTPFGSGGFDNIRFSLYVTYVQTEGYAKATKATLPDHGNIASISFYSHATGNFRLAIYSGTTSPSSKLLETSSSMAATASAWNTVPISSFTPTSLSLSAGTYWLVWQWDAATSGPSYTAGSSGDGNYMVLAYGAFPASWSGGTSSSEKWSVYVTYTIQYQQTITSSPVTGSGYVTVDGGAVTTPYTVWWNSGSSHTIAAISPVTVVSGQSQYVWRSWSDSGAQSHSVAPTATTTYTANFKLQYYVTFSQTGVGTDFTGTVFTLNGTGYGRSGNAAWWDSGDTIAFAYQSPLTVTANVKRYTWSSTSGTLGVTTQTGSKVVSGYGTVIGNYQTQFYITLSQTGVASDFSGTVVTVDGSGLDRSDHSFWWYSGSVHSFSFESPLAVNSHRYVWASTSGTLGKTLQSDSITVSGSGTVVGNYLTQYQVTFGQTGLDSTAAGTIVTVNETANIFSDLPYIMWVESGSLVTYSYNDMVLSSESGRRFNLTGITGSASPITVSEATTVTGNYQKQWNIIFDQSGVLSYGGIVVIIDGENYGTADLSIALWWDDGSTHSFSFNSPLVVAENAEQYVWANTTGISSDRSDPSFVASINGAITGNYKTQYYLTVNSDRDTPIGQGWYDSGATASFSVSSPASGGSGIQYVCTGFTGDASGAGTSGSITMDGSKTVTFGWKTQFYLTLETSPSGVDSPSGEDWYDSEEYAPISTDQYVDIVSGSSRYSFAAWSTGDMGEIADPSATSTTVLMDKAKTVTATYVTQYYLTVISTHDSPSGEGWYNAGDTADFAVTSPVSGGSGIRYVCIGFTGDASGSSTSGSILMDGPKTVTFIWKTQYQITITSSGINTDSSGTVATLNGSAYTQAQLPYTAWFDDGYSLPYAFSSPVSAGAGKQYLWSSTSGLSQTLQSNTFTVSNYGTITGTYGIQYYLTVTGGNSPSGEGWYDSGASALASSTWVWDTFAGQSRRALTTWLLDGSDQNSTRSNTGNLTVLIIMSKDHAVFFVSTDQEYLTVIGGNSISFGTESPTSDQWYDFGTSTTVSSDWVWNTVSGSRTAVTNYAIDGVDQNPARQGSGTLTTSSVDMFIYHTVAFASTTQYLLTNTLISGSVSSITPSPTVDSWYDDGTPVDVVLNYVWDAGASERKNLFSYTIDGSTTNVSRAGSGTFAVPAITMTAAHSTSDAYVTQYYLTVDTSPSGVNSPSGEGWYDAGTYALISTDQYVDLISGSRYRFDGWTTGDMGEIVDPSSTSTTVLVDSAKTVTANYVTQYYLTVDSAYDTPSGEGWYDSGVTANFSVTSPVSGGADTQYVCTGFTGDASGSGTSGSILMNNSKTITFNWKTQYYLTVSSAHDTPSGEGWYDAGDTAYASLSDGTVSGGVGTQYVFTGWSGDASGSGLTSDPIIMDYSKTATADWKTQYYLTVTSLYDTPSGEGWYDANDTAYALLSNGLVSGGSGTQYVFVDWSNDASGSDLTSDPITMDGPKTATANWKTQYYLTVDSAYDTPSGEGWYDSGDTAYALLSDGTVSGGIGIQYVFTGWSGDASGSSLTSDPLIMDGPKTATADWKTQYYLTVTSDHDTPSGEGWYDSGSTTYASLTDGVVSGGSGVRYVFVQWTGDASGSGLTSDPITMDYPKTATAAWKTQYYITFDQTGVGDDFSGVVLTINGTGYNIYLLPSSFWWDNSSVHSFNFESPLVVTAGEKRYVLTSVNETSGFIVSGSETIIGSYKTQYYVTFSQSGVGSDFSGTVVTVNGTDYDRLGFSAWTDDGDSYIFDYKSPLVTDGKRYVLTNVNETSSFTVSGPETIMGTYNGTQYLVSFGQSGSGVPPQVAYHIDNGSVVLNTAPFDVWVDSGSNITYYYAGFVLGGAGVQYVFTGVTPDSPQTVTGNLTITATYGTQYLLMVVSAHDSPLGQGWYDSGVLANFSVSSPVSGGSSIQYVCTGFTGNASGSGTSGSVTMSSPATITFSWKIQFYLTVVSVYDSPSGAGWYDSDVLANFSVTSPVAGDTGIQYVCTGFTGNASGSGTSGSVTMSSPATITFSWKTQYYVTFSQSGVGSDFSGTVVTVNGTDYDRLGFSAWTDDGDSYIFDYKSPLVTDGKRYVLTNVNETSSFTVSGPETIMGTYNGTQYLVSFTQSSSGVNPTVSYSIDNGSVIVNTVPFDVWVDNGSSIAYTYQSPVSGGVGIRYLLTDTSPTSPQTITGNLTVTGTYKTQYYLTVDTSPSGVNSPFGQGWYDFGANASISTDQYVDIVPGSSRYRFDGWTTGDMGEIANSSAMSTTVLIDVAKTVTANYVTQYYLTVETSPSSINSPSGEGWYDASSYASVSTDSFFDVSPGVGYRFYDWSTADLSEITDPSAASTTVQMDGSKTVTANYVLQYQVTFNYHVSSGSGYSAPTVSYFSLGVLQNVTASPSTTVWADADSTYIYNNPLLGSNATEQWMASPDPTGTISAAGTIDPEYWHQLYMTFNYYTSDGSASADPTVYYQQFGNPLSNTVEFSDWADAGSSWSYENPTSDSNSFERWMASPDPTGTVSVSEMVDPEYWHQFYMDFDYHTSDGSSTAGPNVDYQQFGSSVSDTAEFSDWADADSTWTYDNPTGDSTSSERWVAESTPTETVSAADTIDPEYWHQFYMTFSYYTSDGSSTVGPTVYYQQFDGDVSATAGFSDWADAGSVWSYDNPTDDSTSDERWIASSDPAGIVSVSETIDPEYFHQFYVSVNISTSDGSSVFPQFDYYQFGSSLADYGSFSDWMDVDSSWSIQAQVDIPLTERYVLDPFESSSGVVDTDSFSFDFWHQYYVSVSISTNDGSPAFPQFDYYQFGSPLAGYGSGGDWMDVGSSWNIQSQVDISGTERYILDPFESSSGVVDSTDLAFDFWHQLFVSVNVSTNDGSPALPQFDYYQFGSPLADYGSFSDWMDVGSSWSIQSQVDVSGSERYMLDPFEFSSGVVDTDSFSFDFWHQLYVFVDISTNDGSPAFPQFDYYQFGVSQAGYGSFSDWMDVDSSWSIQTQVDISGSERYILDPFESSSGFIDSDSLPFDFWHQFYLTVETSPSGVNSPSGNGWYNAEDYASISTDQYVDIVSGSSRYNFTGWSTSDMGEIDDPLNISTMVYMDGAKTVTANYITQYYLTVDTSPSGVNSPFGQGWYDYGSSALISTDQYVDIVSGSSRYRFNGWTTGNMSEIDDPSMTTTTVLMDSAKTVTAEYIVQYSITFDQTGVGFDFTGPVVNIDGADYGFASLPTLLWFDNASTHSFSYYSPLSVSSGKQYVWNSTSGISTLQDDTFAVSSSGSIVGNYKTQYYLTVNSAHDTPLGEGWYDSDLTANFSVSSPVSGGSGIQYVCTGYTGDASGSDASGSIVMNSSKTITFNWKTQYYVTFSQSGVGSDFSGTVVTVNGTDYDRLGFSAWTDNGDVYTFDYKSPLVTDGKRYVLTNVNETSSFTVSGPETITGFYNTAQYKVSFTQSGSSVNPTVSYQIDGGSVVVNTVPFDVWVNSGSNITYTYENPVSGGIGVQYVLIDTSPASSQTITGNLTVTGTYKTQFYLTVTSTHDSPTGEGWYDSGVLANFSVTSPVSGGFGVQYVCTGFTGDASGSGISGSVLMNESNSVTFSWKTQFYLTVVSAYDTPLGEGWYDSGDIANFSVSSPAPGGLGVQYVCTGFTGDASGSGTSGSVTMNDSKTVTFTWKTQFYLTVISAYDTPLGAGWYDSGVTAGFNVSSPVAGVSGVQYVCTGFTGDASGSGTSGSILMNSPKAVTFTWKTQYYLTVDSAYDTPSGENWYDASSTAYASLSNGVVSDGVGTQHVFTGWGGDASGIGLTSNSIIMNSPKTATANWKTQYYLTVTSSAGSETPVSGWFDAGANITAYVTSPVSGGSGIQYVCTGWAGAGSVPASGSGTLVNFTINAPSSITWNWKTQFYLTVASAHGTVGGQGWYDSGSIAYATVTPLIVSGPSDIQYVFTSWGDDASGSTSPSNPITMSGPKTATANWKTQYYLTVNSTHDSPSGAGWYDSGATAGFSVSSPAAGPTGVRYICTGFTGDASGSGTSGSILMDGPKLITFTWKTQYYLTVSSAHDTPLGQGWYDSGVLANFSVSSPVSGGSGIQYVCTGYTGDASGSGTSGSITMSEPKIVTFSWKTQYYLTVSSAYDSPTPLSGWFDSGSSITESVTSPVSGGAGTRFVCTGWSGTGSVPSSGSASSVTFSITTPSSIIWNWKTQYYLTVTSLHDSPVGEGWYDSGATAGFSVTSPVSGGTGIRYVCTGFTGDASGSGASGSILMNNQKSITFTWKTQYYLTVTSPYDTPSGEGWYDSASVAHASIASGTISGGVGIQYVFTQWSGDASGTGLTSDPITMNGPKTATADWKTQYYLTVSSSHDSPTPLSGWFDSGSSITESVTSPISGVIGTRYVCTGWAGTGSVPASGSASSVTFTITAPSSINWNWKTQYYLTVNSAYDTPTGQGWYDAASTAGFSVSSPVSGGTGIQYLCTGFTGDASGSGTSGSILMSSPKSITFTWKTQYYLTVSSSHDAPTGAGWYDTGSTADFGVTSPVSGGSGVQYVCTGFTGDAFGFGTSGSILMDGPKTVTFSWKTQYYLVVSSAYDSPTPSSGWFDSGSSINASVTSPVAGGSGVQYFCTGWSGTGSVPASGSAMSVTFTIGAPSTITWNWNTQYQVTFYQTGVSSDFTGTVVTVDGVNYGVSGLPVSFWWDQSSSHSFSFDSTLVVNASKQYSWDSTFGLSTLQSETLTITVSGSVVGNYIVQNQITFDQVGVSSDFTGTVIIIDSVSYSKAQLPISFSWSIGSSHSFAFQSPLVVSASSKQYVWTGTTGLSSSQSDFITVTSYGSIIGHYETQYYLTVTSPHDSPTPLSGWFNSGSSITESVTSPVSGVSGIQYVCTGWTGGGSVPALGSTSSVTFTITAPSSITWNWETQYYLTVNSAHDTPTGQGWYDVSSTAGFSVSSPVSGGLSVQYVCTGFTGDASGSGTSGFILMNSPKSITFTWNTQYYLTVSSAHDSPSGQGWYDSGATVGFGVTSPVSGGSGVRYVCTGFTGDASGSGTSGSILMNSPKAVTFTWKTQYYLTVSSSHDTPTGEGWYNAGSTADFGVTSPVSGGSGVQYVCTGFTGDASGSGTNGSITMSNPKTVTFSWKTQYYLTVNSPYDTPSGEGWYDSSSTAYASLTEGVVSNGSGTRYVFTAWSDDASGTGLTSDPIMMDGPKTAIAEWIVQYYLTVNSTYDSPSGQGWYDSGATADFSVSSPVMGSVGVRYVCTGYDGDASGSGTDGSIIMDCPKTVTFMWKVQYYLTVTSVHDTPSGEGWYDAASVAYASLSTGTVSGETGTRYVFARWTGDASGINLVSNPITMDGPKTAIAYWTAQYSLVIQPSADGTTSPSSGTYWYDEGITPDVTANSSSGYVFDRWVLDGSDADTNSVIQVLMNQNHTLQPLFTKLASVTFRAFGVSSDALSWGLTVDSTFYSYTSLPITFIWPIGSVHTYSFSPLISSTVQGKRFSLVGVDGPGSPLTVTADANVTGNYKVQFYLTVNSAHDTPSGEGWYDSDSIAYASLSTGTVSGGAGVRYVFTGWSEDVSGSSLTSDPITMDRPKTATADWKTQFYLTITSMHDSPFGQGWYDTGTTANFGVSSPTAGSIGVQYICTGYDGDASGFETEGSISMNAAKTVTFNWKTQYYLTIVSAYGSPSGEGWYDKGSTAYATLSEGTVLVSGTQYKFTGWSNDASGTGLTSDPITMDSSKMAEAVWTAYYTLTITVAPVNDGTTNPAAGQYTYSQGTEILVTATPNDHYAFAYWLLDGVEYNDTSITITMDSDHNLQAIFTLAQLTLTISTSTGGTTEPGPGVYVYDYGANVSVTVTPNAGYIFSYWLLDGVNVTSSSITLPTDGTHTLQAVFTVAKFTLNISSTAGGSTNPLPGNYTYDYGTNVTLAATPNSGYVFKYWLVDGNIVENSSITILINSNHTIHPVFEAQPLPWLLVLLVIVCILALLFLFLFLLLLLRRKLDITTTAGGTTNPKPGAHRYLWRKKVEITPTPYSGYSFSHWVLDGEVVPADHLTEGHLTVIMNRNHTVQAVFFRLETVFLNNMG